MPVQTTLVTVSASTFDPAVPILDCTTVSVSPLYMKELVIEGIAGLGAASPVGTVRPGTPQHGATHTIYVDSTDPILHKIAPFTLSITYDTSQNYKVLRLTSAPQARALIEAASVRALSPNDAVEFITQALAAFYPAGVPAPDPSNGGDAPSAAAYGTA